MPPPFPSYPEWFAARRHALSRNGLWLDGGEPGRPDPAGFDQARIRILICRLSPYDDVLASITHRVLLRAAMAVPGVFADLAFFPSETDAALMEKDGVPLWLATGSKRAPADFDVLAVSLSVQQEALNLPAALQKSGLRLDAAGRLADARHPWIFLGGHGAASVPFVHGDAAGPGSGGLVDAVCLGDGIGWLRDVLRRLSAGKIAGSSKQSLLESFAREVPGSYVPSLYRHAWRENQLASIEPQIPGIPMPVEFRQDPIDVWLEDYDGAYIPFSDEETEETLPLAAGCVYRCRFCQTGWMRRDFSSASANGLAKAALRFKAAMANADLNLLASDACSVDGLESALDALCPLFRRVSVKSLSVSSLVRKPDSFRLLEKMAKHEFTFGVEGVSARLRAYLGKPATAADLLRIAGSLAAQGLRQLKLFFIATGLEEDGDLKELGALLKNLRSQVPSCRIVASFMPLFHAPFTPLQFAPVLPLSPDVANALADVVHQTRAEFRWSAFPDEIARMDRLCRAGRAATPVIVQFSIQRGLRYARSVEPRLVRELAEAIPFDAEEKQRQSVFPWSDLQASAPPSLLWQSYQKACQDRQSSSHAQSPAQPARSRTPSATPRANKPCVPQRFFFWIQIPQAHAHHPDHVAARRFFRTLFTSWPDGVPAYLGNPALLRPPGAAGLALASAEFRHGTPLPASGMADSTDFKDESLLFGVHWPTPDVAATILQSLQQGRVKFQTFRRETSRWHVVERPFRAKSGIAALREKDGQTWLFCHRRPALLEQAPLPRGIVRSVLSKTDSSCPACNGSPCRTLQSADTETPPACFDCLSKQNR